MEETRATEIDVLEKMTDRLDQIIDFSQTILDAIVILTAEIAAAKEA